VAIENVRDGGAASRGVGGGVMLAEVGLGLDDPATRKGKDLAPGGGRLNMKKKASQQVSSDRTVSRS
jgi:hypothetical protein